MRVAWLLHIFHLIATANNYNFSKNHKGFLKFHHTQIRAFSIIIGPKDTCMVDVIKALMKTQKHWLKVRLCHH